MMSQRAKNCLSDNCRHSRVDCRAYLHMNGCRAVAWNLLERITDTSLLYLHLLEGSTV